MSNRKNLEKLLASCTKPTEIRDGNGNHLKIIVGGRLVGVFPKGRNNDAISSRYVNLVAAIRREDRV